MNDSWTWDIKDIAAAVSAANVVKDYLDFGTFLNYTISEQRKQIKYILWCFDIIQGHYDPTAKTLSNCSWRKPFSN